MSFHTFLPVYRGQPAENAPDLNLARIASFGLMISGAQAEPGAFRLELASLSAYTSKERP